MQAIADAPGTLLLTDLIDNIEWVLLTSGVLCGM